MTVTFRSTRIDSAEALDLLEAYEAELLRQGIILDQDEGGGVAPDELLWPRGCFYLVELDGLVVACGGVRRLEPDVAEIKRMYVASSARRRGIAAELLAQLEKTGRRLNCRRARLDTGPGMAAALAFYQGSGYYEIPDYNGNPHAAYWLEKPLGDVTP